jgi:PhnB protein
LVVARTVVGTAVRLNPYLDFDGRCREAFEFYAKTFGGRITFMQTIGDSPMASTLPVEMHGRIMHATLEIGSQVLQGADAPGVFTTPAGFSVAVHFDDVADGQRVFDALAEGGTVRVPFQATFWAKGFGMVVDRFETPWIVNAGEPVA